MNGILPLQQPGWRGICLLLLLVVVTTPLAQGAEDLSAVKIAAQLEGLKTTLAVELTAELQQTNFNSSYTTVWRAYEDAVIAGLEKILPRHIPELTDKNFDAGQSGREKNRLADFAIVCGTNVIEVSIKAARASANPENDMGTFHDHARREQLFAASFTVWVRYDDSGGSIRCDRVFFDRTWRFAGKSTLVDGVKYRKKDGNMRPKPWAMFDRGVTFWQTEEEFETAVKRAEAFRASEVVNERLKDLTEADQRLLYDRLRTRLQTNTALDAPSQ